MVTRVGVKNAVQAALLACGASASLPVLALGLGELEMRSFLNEPLRAEVELLDTRQLTVDDIRIRLAGNDDFDRLGVERSFFLTGIQFEVEVDPASGRGVIRLSTQDAVLEPYLDLIIEARWPSGRLLREYTVLVDPPTFKQELITVSASDRVEAVERQPAPQRRDEPSPAAGTEPGVAVRESSLAPGEMPARAFSAETAERPNAGNRYMVRRDETLWQIAQQGRPDGVSIQQAMLDIQRLNPEAFIDGNINRIKAGYIIYLPAAGDISSDDLARALEEVRDQNQQWQASRGEPGVTAAATLRVSADADAGSLTDSGAGGVSSVDAGSVVAAVTPSDQSLAASAADAAAAATAGLAAQLDSMVERLDTLEQIVALKDEQIATLEQALREAREAAAAQAAAPAPEPVARTSPTPAPVTTPAPAPAPATDTRAFPWLTVAGGLLVLVLGALYALLVVRRRAAGEATVGADARAAAIDSPDDDVFAGVSLKKEALSEPAPPVAAPEEELEEEYEEELESTPESAAVRGADDGGSRGYGERKHDDYIDEAGGADALAEADIYIAYGRYLQAIELLNTAIENEPENSAYRLKLIELYVDMGEEDSAAGQLDALREYADAEAVERGEALLGAGGGVGAPGLGPASAGMTAASVANDAAAPRDAAASEGPPRGVEAVPELGMADLDALSKEQAGTADTTDSLDLDLQAVDEASEATEATAADSDIAEDFDDLDGLGDVQFDNLEIEEDGRVQDTGFAEHIEFAGAEEELDLSDALSESVELDLDDATDSDAGEELVVAEDADQMATKLDLARAYMDMGDSSGARSILEEVAVSGTDEQQQEARELMGRIA